MQITITTGTGKGPTSLAAFDAALRDAGVANYNLIYLSSVIPTQSVIQRAKYVTPITEYGYRLYLVMARQDAQVVGEMAWAGLGWTQEQETGRGLFVELHGTNRSQLERDIHATLSSMIVGRPLRYGPIELELVGIKCHGEPVCALAMAVYQSEGWKSNIRRAKKRQGGINRGSRFSIAPYPKSPALTSRVALLEER
jgi:arginine decarboxylase